MTAEMSVQITLALANVITYFYYIRVLELVDRIILRFIDLTS
jgi:hypothetical protein